MAPATPVAARILSHGDTDNDPVTFARSYQLEALEKSMRENTIVFLETGSGKTLIAVMLIRTYAYMIRKPSNFISIFLVPTVVLVNQQATVVETNTDLKVGRYWGDMGVDFWDSLTWQGQIDKYELLVMTPQILLDALRHSFLKLEMIKLLIFDECHHAKGSSPYACIMNEFYHPQMRAGSRLLPRIFGMTASPINSKGFSSSNHYGKHILQLESLMNSKVYTVVHESILAAHVAFSTVKPKFYKHVEMQQTLFFKLDRQLKQAKFKTEQSLKELQLEDTKEESALKRVSKLFGTFIYCLTDLGIWFVLKAAESLTCTETHNLFWGHSKDGVVERIMRGFCQDVFLAFSTYVPSDWNVGDSSSADLDGGLLTAKVYCLIESLKTYRTTEDLRCIIFVERVITAIVLKSLLGQVSDLRCINATYMAGQSSGLQFQSRNKQLDIIEDFRKGKVNIIVATQILEEGLDVQGCNLVIRFDPPTTVCSFIQSRGRARKQGSDYLLILRSADDSTLSKVNNHMASGGIMREESLRNASIPCAPQECVMDDESFYRVEATGAVVTLNSSVALIYFYCSHLPSDGYFRSAPRFVIDEDICTLHLPKSCPIQTVRFQGQKNMLKRFVCLEACKKLHIIGALTDNLLPEAVVEEVDAQDIGDTPCEDQVANYYPTELITERESDFEGLYQCYKIVSKQNFEYNIPLSDIALLVKCDPKSYEDLNFQLEVDRGSVTVNVVYAGTICLDVEQVFMARSFLLTLMRILIHRDSSEPKNNVNTLHGTRNHPIVHYLLLPINCGEKSVSIDWNCVKSSLYPSTMIRRSESVVRNPKNIYCPKGCACQIHAMDVVTCRCIIENSLVITPHNGYIYCVTGVLNDLNGNSVMENDIGEYALTYKKYYKYKHGINLRYTRDSLLRARHIFTVQNWLHKHNHQKEKDGSNAWVELPPELCCIIMSPITVSTLYSFSLVPSIMHRFESTLIALHLKAIQFAHFNNKSLTIPTMKVLEAITTKKCQEEISLESLETLGDSFLKYAVSQNLFRINSHHHEGLLTIRKGRLISNKYLCRLGCQRQLQGFIRNEYFDPKEWVIPGENSGSIMLDETLNFGSRKVYIKGKRYMKSKVVADVVEALIGAYLNTCGEFAALNFMDWLGMEVSFGNELPNGIPLLMLPEKLANISYLESLLRYSFRDPSILVEALTHGSYQLSDVPRCYQRLEFLGDSILDYLITIYMYNKYPGISPGLLTDLRSASVNNDCYAHAAVNAGLYKHILHASAKLQKDIELFANSFEQIPSKSSFGWDSEKDVPKVLGDIIESLAGAILVDSNYNKDAVWESMKHLLEPLVTPETVKLHPVRELSELCQRRSFELKTSVSYENGTTSVTVEVKAEGRWFTETCTSESKKTSKKLAHKAVLNSMKESVFFTKN